MTTQEAKQKIDTDPDFIASKRFEYSMAKALERYPDGLPTPLIAQALLLTEDEVEQIERQAIEKLRHNMKVF